MKSQLLTNCFANHFTYKPKCIVVYYVQDLSLDLVNLDIDWV